MQSFWGPQADSSKAPISWPEQPYQQLLWRGLQWSGNSGSSDSLAPRRNLCVTLHMWWSVQYKLAAGGPVLAWQAHGPTYNALRCLCCHEY